MSLSRRVTLKSLAVAVSLLPFRAWAAPSTTGYYRLMQGPMIGATHPDKALIWARASASVPVEFEFSEHENLSGARRTAPAMPSGGNDYTVLCELDGLKPATRYYYRPVIGGVDDRYLKDKQPFSFMTRPLEGSQGKLRIAFGSCARIQAYPEQPVWDAVADWNPDMFLWLGDNVYHDTLEPQIMAEMYRWQRKVPNLEELGRSVPQLAIWDDHDYALNDSDRTNSVKDQALAAFKRYWANPSYGLPNAEGVFFKHSWGDVDLLMLDVRWYRDPADTPDGPAKTMLGEAQLDWLKKELKNSKATFKLLVSGSGWSAAKGPEGDAWSAFMTERNALFDFIRDQQIEGVVLLSGDTHVGEFNCIPRSAQGGYDLYELVSSPLAQDTRTSWLDRRPELRMREVYVGSQNFGTVEVDTAAADPKITFNLVDIRGNRVWDPLTVHASELRNGVRSWEDKIDPLSRSRHDATVRGLDYYSPDLGRD